MLKYYLHLNSFLFHFAFQILNYSSFNQFLMMLHFNQNAQLMQLTILKHSTIKNKKYNEKLQYPCFIKILIILS